MYLDGPNGKTPLCPPSIASQAPMLWLVFFFSRSLFSPVNRMALGIPGRYSMSPITFIFQAFDINIIFGAQLNESEPQLWLWMWVKVKSKKILFQVFRHENKAMPINRPPPPLSPPPHPCQWRHLSILTYGCLHRAFCMSKPSNCKSSTGTIFLVGVIILFILTVPNYFIIFGGNVTSCILSKLKMCSSSWWSPRVFKVTLLTKPLATTPTSIPHLPRGAIWFNNFH